MILPHAIRSALSREARNAQRIGFPIALLDRTLWAIHIDHGARAPPQTLLIDSAPYAASEYIAQHVPDTPAMFITWTITGKQNRAYLVPFIDAPTGQFANVGGFPIYILPGSIRPNPKE